MTHDQTPQRADVSADDEIVAELRAIRWQLGAAVGFDLDRLFQTSTAYVRRLELCGTSAGFWWTDRRRRIDCIGCSMDIRNEFCR